MQLKSRDSFEMKVAITLDVEERPLCSPALSVPLEILDQHNIKATFFILGRFAEQNPEETIEILSRGHELGCHGYEHDPPYDERQFDEVKTDIRNGTRVLRRFGDVTCFRSPYFRAHMKLAKILEAFGYCCDSSVPAKRFDLFFGKTTNPNNLLCPVGPYNPSIDNIYRRGNSEITEIPLSGFVFSLLGTTMRNLGFKIFVSLLNFVNLFSEVIVFDIHQWEFAEAIKGSVRHRRKRGIETAVMFDELLSYLKRSGSFTKLSELTL